MAKTPQTGRARKENYKSRYLLLKLGKDPFPQSDLRTAKLHDLSSPKKRHLQKMLQNLLVVGEKVDRSLVEGLGANILYLALPGGGKTFFFLKLRNVIEEQKKRDMGKKLVPLVIIYDDFSSITETPPPYIAQAHIQPLLRAVARASLRWIKAHLELFECSELGEQKWWVKLINAHYSGTDPLSLWPGALKPLAAEVGAASTAFSATTTLEATLSDIADRINPIGISCVYLLIDGLEASGGAKTALELIHPLLSNAAFFDDDRIIWKINLDASLAENLKQYDAVQNRLDVVSLELTDEELTQVLNNRIVWANEKRVSTVTTLGELCDDDLLNLLKEKRFPEEGPENPNPLEMRLARLARSAGAPTPRRVQQLARDMFTASSAERLTKADYESMLAADAHRRTGANMTGPYILSSQETRLKNLDQLLQELNDKLTDYERELPDVEDLKKKHRYQKDIQELKELIRLAEQEYGDLRAKITPGSFSNERFEGIQNLLREQQERVEQLNQRVNDQEQETKRLTSDIDDLRLFVLDQYPARERRWLKELVEDMTLEQLGELNRWNQVIDESSLNARQIQVALQDLRVIVESYPEEPVEPLRELISEAKLDGKLGLKVALPIVFPFLQAEGEVCVSFSTDLKAWWQRLQGWISRLR